MMMMIKLTYKADICKVIFKRLEVAGKKPPTYSHNVKVTLLMFRICSPFLVKGDIQLDYSAKTCKKEKIHFFLMLQVNIKIQENERQ